MEGRRRRGGEALKSDDYCSIHLCQKKYCRRRHSFPRRDATGQRAASKERNGGRSSRWNIPRSERRRLAQFIRQNRNPPLQKSGVGYYPIKTPHGMVEMTPIERKMYRRLTGAGLSPRCQFPVGPYRIDVLQHGHMGFGGYYALAFLPYPLLLCIASGSLLGVAISLQLARHWKGVRPLGQTGRS